MRQNATYAFSAWVKAPADIDGLGLQLKYKVGGEWQYPGGNEGTGRYDRFGAWQRIEARLDLSQITDIERLSAIIRVKGTGQVAYIDNVRLVRLRPDPQQAPVMTEGYEYDGGDWRLNLSNQSRSNERAYEGRYSWRVESSNDCSNGCKYMTHERVNAAALDLDATYLFSAWVWAPEDHDNIDIQMKYRAGGEWKYPGGAAKAQYDANGGWQYLEVRLDLSQISGLELLDPVTRNVGSRAIACYWDEVTFRKETSDDRYRLQVAKDAAFDTLLTSRTGLAATSRADTLDRYERSYYWRLRGVNGGGAGPWSAGQQLTTEEAPPRRYYVKDHLGSVRAVVDATGEVKEARDYYPFGLRMPGRSTTEGMPATEDFTGYEKDESTQLHYAGQRYYMAAFGHFSTTDRFADKYPSLSPYQHALNNPANFVDVNGDSVWVVDGGERFLYTEGAEYGGQNEFIAKAVSILNTIGSVEGGSKVLSSLIESKSNYNLLNQKPTSEKIKESQKALQFDPNEGGGADILAGALTGMSEGAAIESIAHETFHGYQQEIGQDPRTTYSEVGAYVFGPSIRIKLKGGIYSSFSTPGNAGAVYDAAMTALFYGGSFARAEYRRAAQYFKKGSRVGGAYSDHPTGPIPANPVISRFYPLFP